MAGTRELEAMIARAVGAGGRVILVGDHHQLPEVTAGGGFAALATKRTVTVAELTINRRQTHEWERVALGELRDGNVAAAVARLPLTTIVSMSLPTMRTMLDRGCRPLGRLLSDWSQPGAPRRHQQHRRRPQPCRPPAPPRRPSNSALISATWAGLDLAVGEHVVLRANDYRTVDLDGRPTPLLNGHTATDRRRDGRRGARPAGPHRHHRPTRPRLPQRWRRRLRLRAHLPPSARRDVGHRHRRRCRRPVPRSRLPRAVPRSDRELAGPHPSRTRRDSTATSPATTARCALPGEEPEDVDTNSPAASTSSRAKTLALTDDPLRRPDQPPRRADHRWRPSKPSPATPLAAESRALADRRSHARRSLAGSDRRRCPYRHPRRGRPDREAHPTGTTSASSSRSTTPPDECSSSSCPPRDAPPNEPSAGTNSPSSNPATRQRRVAALDGQTALDRIVGGHRIDIDRWARSARRPTTSPSTTPTSTDRAVDRPHRPSRGPDRRRPTRLAHPSRRRSPDRSRRSTGLGRHRPRHRHLPLPPRSHRRRHAARRCAPSVADQPAAWDDASTIVGRIQHLARHLLPNQDHAADDTHLRGVDRPPSRTRRHPRHRASRPAPRRQALAGGQLTLDDTDRTPPRRPRPTRRPPPLDPRTLAPHRRVLRSRHRTRAYAQVEVVGATDELAAEPVGDDPPDRRAAMACTGARSLIGGEETEGGHAGQQTSFAIR